MLTPEHLAEIRTRRQQLSTSVYMDVDTLLDEVQRLTRHNQRMSAALAQLSDIGNWEYLAPDQRPAFLTVWCYSGPDNPAVLAERAPVEDN